MTTATERYESAVRRFRHAVGPLIDRVARTMGTDNYRIRRRAYVGTVHCSFDELERRLSKGGFSWDPLSLYHRTPIGTTTDGSWAYRPSPFADRQVHVVLFAQAEDRIDVYAHEEYNWLRHPIKHALQQGIDREAGAAWTYRWMNEQGLPFDHESVVIRKAAHVVERVRELAVR